MAKSIPYQTLRKGIFLLFLFFGTFWLNHTQAQSVYNFTSSGLQGAILKNPTSLQFGPDGRLYVSQQDGIIKVFSIIRNAANNYSVTDTETINLINGIPNHNDDGSLATNVTSRQITGILVTGTPTQPILYVSSSDSRIGGPGGDKNLDTNSGVISRLTRVDGIWAKLDLVRGLPRSEENHSVNGMQLDEQNNILYLAVGGSTNAGSPSTNFAYLTEYALSAAILSIDLLAIDLMPTLGSGNTAYKYDIPTVDDPTRSNNMDGTDINDPFGGNDGLNQAKLVVGGPVQIYSAGYRNPYDLVITKTPGTEGRLYTIDNGANQGWGGYPELEGPLGTATNNYVEGEPGSTGPGINDPQVNNLDNLHYVGNIYSSVPGSHYGGHPSPIRANPSGAGLYTHNGTTGVWRTSKTGSNPLPQDWPPVPLEMANPIEGDFQLPGVSDLSLLTFGTSTNGITEYTASNFNNALKGVLLAAGFNGNIFKILLSSDGTDVTNSKNSTNKLNTEVSFASGFGSQPLDITAQGDIEIFPGSVWAATYGSHAITIFEPQDMDSCTGVYSIALDEDQDGYTNADEIDNLTDPCSAASKPGDFDMDFVSDLNDLDDDGDGLPDVADYFALDPTNGLEKNIPVIYELLNNDPGTGLFGLGFTGLMNNGTTNYLNDFDESNLIAGGATGAFSVVEVPSGDALGGLNNQKNGFQFGVNIQTADGPFTVQGRMIGPFFNNMTPQNHQSHGIFIGTGDQDNYLKIILNSNNGLGGIEVVYEETGSAISYQYPLAGGLPGSTVDLFLSVDPLAGTVQAKYAQDGGTINLLGSPMVVGGDLLTALQSTPALAVGILSTSRESSVFTATWDFIKVTSDPVIVSGQWQAVTPLNGNALARHENAYVQSGDNFYLIGGRGIKAVQAFHPVNRTWTNKANTPIELHHFQAVNLDGLIYVVGAFTGGYPHEKPVANIYIYNPVTDKWVLGPSIPEARRRGSTGVVVYNSKIYLVCGIQDGHWTGHVPWLDEYDPSTNSWKILADAPRARDHFHAEIINGKIYVAGGRLTSASTGEVFQLTVPEVDVYDIATNTWSTLPPSGNIPTKRAAASAAVLGDELIIIGGESEQASAHNETEALNVQTNTWRSLADLQQGRHGSQAIVNNKNIYIAAGSANQGAGPELSSQEAFHMFAPSTPSLIALSQSSLTAPSTIAFGSVSLGSGKTEILSLSNSGNDQAIVLTSIMITGSGTFTSLAPYSLPFIIEPGQSVSLNVSFNPMVGGTHSANLVINHSGLGESTNIALNGEGSGPGLTADPTNLHFFSQQAGTTSSPQAFILTNNTTEIIDISDLSITGTNSSEFNHDVTGLVSLAAGDSTTVNVTFTPASLGTKVAQLNVVHSGTNSPLTLGLTGEGQNNPDPADILYRINSGGPQISTSDGEFLQDNYFTPSPGFTYIKTGEISGTVDDALYHTERSSGTDNGTFHYAFPVANGQYFVVLHFAEIFWTSAGQRIFDVTMEGIKVLDNFDIIAKTGTPMTATTESFSVDVADGILDIAFSAELSEGGINRPKISGIEVIKGSDTNQLPVANAGADIQITAPLDSTTLDGSGTDLDGSVISYMWSQVSGPNTAIFDDASLAKPTITGLITGSYIFSLSVMDDMNGTSLPDEVLVTVSDGQNPDPADILYRINSGGPQISTSDGEFLQDNYFTPSPGFTYKKTGEISGTVDDALYQTERSSATDNGTFHYAFPVENGQFSVVLHFAEIYWTASGKRIFDVTIEGIKALDNFDIIAKTGTPMTATTESFSVHVGDGILDIAFSAELSEGGINRPKVSGIEVIKGSDTNQLPVANAGADIQITAPLNSTMLDGSGTDLDGSVISYMWRQVSGPNTAIFNDASLAKPTITGLITGSYIFSLSVVDDMNGTSLPDEVLVTVIDSVENFLPTVNAGPDQTILLPTNSVLLDSEATDSDGTIISYNWMQVSGPNSASFSSVTEPDPTVTGLIAGSYVFRLTVTDDAEATAFDDVTVTVNDPSLSQQVVSFTLVDATSELDIHNLISGEIINLATLPSQSLNIRANTNPVTVGSVKFSLSGAQVKNVTESGAPYALYGDANGNYNAWVPALGSFTLIATPYTASGGGGSAGTSLTISFDVINQSTGNVVPSANAGPDQSITLPTNSLMLSGSATDPDGDIISYNWTQVSGPNTASITSATDTNPTVSGLVAGIYVFRFTVTDDAEATAFDEVTVTVNDPSISQQVVSFTLVDATNEMDIRNLISGETINLAALPSQSLNIRANTNPATVGSVKFVLKGAQGKNQTETAAPYALFGDNNGNYNPWTPSLGSYSLVGTPYSASGGGGEAGTPLSVNFDIVNELESFASGRQGSGSSIAILPPINEEFENSIIVFPNPAHKFINVKIQSNIPGSFSIKLYDQLGRLQMKDTFTPVSPDGEIHTIDLSGNYSGMCVIVVESEMNNYREVIKVLKN